MTRYLLLVLLTLFLFLTVQQAQAQNCPVSRSWSGGFVSPDTNVCGGNPKINRFCNDSDFFVQTGQECCDELAKGSICSGSITTPNSFTTNYSFQCCFPTPPTPTPTPTPTPQKFVIQGVVYIDRDNNGIVSTGDTLQQGSSLSLQDVTTGSGGIPKSFPTTDTGGFYQTSRIWDDRHFISINLGTVPSGCTAASSPRTIQIFGSDATSNFPIVCQPTPTPTPTCSSFEDCASCIKQPKCGFGGVAIYECREGTSSFCPAVNGQKYTLWNWTSCGASSPQNTCPVPTPN